VDVAYSGPRDPYQDRKFRDSFFHILFERYLLPSVEHADKFYVGGARGMDTKAFVYVLENCIVTVNVVVPFELSDQPREFKDAYRKYKKDPAFKKRIKLIELRSGLKGGAVARAMHLRNEHMIDHSQLLVANPLERYESTGGTWQSIRYAERVGVPRLIASIEEVAARS
jgi:hypothetical protein